MRSQTTSHLPRVLLARRYRLLGQVLGEGAAGQVVVARDELLGRDVAVKVLDRLTDEVALRRALRAARAASEVEHPGVLRILDVEETAPAFVVLELVEARPLAALLERRALPARQAQRIAADVIDAVAALHAAGAVHRDLRAANVLVTAGGRTVVTSAGLAEAALDPGLGLCLDPEPPRPRVAPSPEQALQLSADTRSDVFALGSLLLTLSHAATASGVDAVLQRATAQDPADRQPDGPALRDELRSPPPPPGGTEFLAAIVTTELPAADPPPPVPDAATAESPPSWRLPLLFGLVAVVALVVGVVMTFGGGDGHVPGRASASAPATAPAPEVPAPPDPQPAAAPLRPATPDPTTPTDLAGRRAAVVEEGRGRDDLGPQTDAFVERLGKLDALSGAARAAEVADLYGIAAVDAASDGNSPAYSAAAADVLRPELSLDGLIALIGRNPTAQGPGTPRLVGRLGTLTTLSDGPRLAEVADLYGIVAVGGGNGDFTPTFSAAATDVLRPELTLDGLIALADRGPASAGPASVPLAVDLRRLTTLTGAELTAAATALLQPVEDATARGDLSPPFARAVTDVLLAIT